MKMPASFAEFSDALQKARIKDGSFCKNELTCIHYNGLTHAMIGWNANLYDLNLFAQRLASLTEEQKKGMDALLKIKQNHRVAPIPLNQLINLTYNTDICCFAPRVSNHEELGAFLYANEMLSNEAMALLDTTEEGSGFQERLLELLGEQHQEDHGGVFTDFGYAELGGEIKDIYVCQSNETACFHRSDAPVMLEVRKGFFNDPSYDNDKTAVLNLPAADAGIWRAVEKVDAASVDECAFRCVDCLIPFLRDAIVNPQNMQKEDFVKGGTATGPMLDFLAACLRYGVSVCVAGAPGSGKTTVAGWLLTTIPDNKRIFTIENGSRELDLVREKDGRVCNSVIHTITRESENAKQNIDQDMLLDMALRYHPDIICVGEMRSAEAYAAQEAARTGHGVLTTIHSNSSQATWRRMVTLCKRKHEMADDTLMDLVTEAFPIVVFAKQLEDKSRKIMEIMECEILPTGERRYNTLYHFKIEENRLEDGKYRIKGRHEAVNPISESLQKRFIDNGMPQEVLTQLVGKKSAPSKGKSGSSPAKAGQATPAPKTRSAQSKPPAKPETGKEGGESV